ncbi:MAG: lipoprotein insertase outer membrane protein LolB [Candidatus Dactylopiibacterium sp.]|nr:lipoprotein insertase outer membrane protein LolB [Candidatus Dactylopiibacterium sp.]
MNRLFRLAGLLAALLLAACASTPPAPQVPVARPVREALQSFAFNGRVAITQGRSSNTVRIAWEHAPARDVIGFATPLGTVLAELQSTPEGALWTNADGDRYAAPTADRLITRLTDKPVPVNALALWVTGRLSPRAEGVERDALGRLRQASDQGWSVRVTAYESDLPNALPRALDLEYPDLRLRIAIEEWFL